MGRLCEEYGRDFDGLKTAVVTVLSGDCVKVRTKSYMNDMVTFKNRDDVITAPIHLGYLACDRRYETAFIPNEEIRMEFVDAVEDKKWNELLTFQQYVGDILLVEISYDKKDKRHGCKMERLEKHYENLAGKSGQNTGNDYLSD